MKMSSIATAIAVVSLVSSPVLAQTANPAEKLSVSAVQAKDVRAGVTSSEESKLEGTTGILVALLAAAAVIAGIIIIADDNPSSP